MVGIKFAKSTLFPQNKSQIFKYSAKKASRFDEKSHFVDTVRLLVRHTAASLLLHE